MRVLLDASIDHETIDEIKGLIESQPAVIEVRPDLSPKQLTFQ
jgi:hypothetical protein